MVAENTATVDRLRAFAVDAARILYKQAPELGASWVMDLVINQDTDEIMLIELTPARNAGLHASSPSAEMRGVHEWLAEHR